MLAPVPVHCFSIIFTNQNTCTSNISNPYLTKMGFLAFGFLKTSKIQNGSQNVSNKKLIDQYIQTWSNLVDSSSSGTNYRMFKDSFKMSKYIKKPTELFYKILLNFKTINHKLPIETGRWAVKENVAYVIII